MTPPPNTDPIPPEPPWAVLLTERELALLRACVAWHSRIHADPVLGRRFAALEQRLEEARPIVSTA